MLLLIAAAMALPLLVNSDIFKPALTKAIKTATGRDTTIEGPVQLSLLPDLKLETGKIALANADGFQEAPLATIDSSQLTIPWLSLLTKQLAVNQFTVKGLTLNLIRNSQGIGNWADWLSAPTPDPTPKELPKENDAQSTKQILSKMTLAALTTSEIHIEQAKIDWLDHQTGRHIEITELDMTTAPLVASEPFAITATLKFEDSQLELAKPLTIKLNTHAGIDKQSNAINLDHSQIDLSGIGDTPFGKTFSANINRITLVPKQSALAIHDGFLKTDILSATTHLKVDLSGDLPSVQGSVAIAPFNPSLMLQRLDINFGTLQPMNQLSIQAELHATPESLDLSNLLATIDDTTINGTLHIEQFSRPRIKAGLTVDNFNVDHYFSVKSAMTPSVWLAAGIISLPEGKLTKLDGNLQLSFNKLTIRGLSMQKLHLDFSLHDGIVNAEQSIKSYYQGSYLGQLTISPHHSHPSLKIDEKFDQIQIEPLFRDYQIQMPLTGLLTLSAQWQLNELQTANWLAGLNGQLKLHIKNAVYKGLNLPKIINGNGSPEHTPFSTISGSGIISNGILQNDDFVANAPLIHVDGKGNIQLSTGVLDYQMSVKLNHESTDSDPSKEQKSVGIHITGTLEQPNYSINIASLLSEKNKAKLDKIIDKVDTKLGHDLGKLLKGILR